jgi:hypothetical protein
MDKAKGTARNVAGDVKSFSGSPRTTRMGMRHRTYGGAGYRQSSPEHPQAIELMSTRFYQGEMS